MVLRFCSGETVTLVQCHTLQKQVLKKHRARCVACQELKTCCTRVPNKAGVEHRYHVHVSDLGQSEQIEESGVYKLSKVILLWDPFTEPRSLHLRGEVIIEEEVKREEKSYTRIDEVKNEKERL